MKQADVYSALKRAFLKANERRTKMKLADLMFSDLDVNHHLEFIQTEPDRFTVLYKRNTHDGKVLGTMGTIYLKTFMDEMAKKLGYEKKEKEKA